MGKKGSTAAFLAELQAKVEAKKSGPVIPDSGQQAPEPLPQAPEPLPQVPEPSPPAPAKKELPNDIDALSRMIAGMISSGKEKKRKESSALASTSALASVQEMMTPIQLSSTQPQFTDGFISSAVLASRNIVKKEHPKTAAYIRVSTDGFNQEDSYETQERYFTNLLSEHDDWISAGIYSDYGLSATSTEKRVGFQRLMRHCSQGKVDRIVCKSISRFARNTADFMNAMKFLSECGVTVLFEKEALDSAEPSSEFILTTLGAIAQEESLSIGQNIRWAFEKRYQNGDAANIPIYGYRYVDEKDTRESGYQMRRVEIVEEEAAIVRRVFAEAAEGKPRRRIARDLNRDHIPAPAPRLTYKNTRGMLKEGLEKGWTSAHIENMLHRERYTGDVLLQKTYTQDSLTHKSLANDGALPMYYVEDHHPAIITRAEFEAAKLHDTRCKNRGPRTQLAFSKRLMCAECGRFYHSGNRYSNMIWRCPTVLNDNGMGNCHSEKVYEEQVIRAVRKAFLERYALVERTLEDDVSVADIFSGRFEDDGEQTFVPAFGSFVSQMKARLEHIQKADYIERDRSFMKRKILAVQTEKEAQKRSMRLAQSELDAQTVRMEVLGEKGAAKEELAVMKAKVETAAARVEVLTSEEEALSAKLEHLEEYWSLLEADYKWRMEALEWMDTLPEGREGTVAFLNGLTGNYVRAFIICITVHSPTKFTFHWFDDTKTEVVMYSNITDYRQTAAYWNGQVMKDNPRYRPK